ncbi:MAG: hemolysin III family protein [Proteobacteria bacterium]|nr:hemolysin III family protein [Pseudomonadota bacterium]
MGFLDRETLADWIVHAIGLACGLAGAVGLIAKAASSSAGAPLLPIGIYVAGLLAMLTCSAVYHVLPSHPRRDWLRRLDHSAIFVMIAGTYTPIAILALEPPWDLSVVLPVWAVAAVGVVLKLVRPKAIESASVALYLLQGWIGLFVLHELWTSLPPWVLAMILLGGLVYSGGVIFHLSLRRYSRALWHGCVLVGAAFHYVAIASLIAA